jgi:hypothetical protein
MSALRWIGFATGIPAGWALALLVACPAPSPVGPPDVVVIDAAMYDGAASTPCQAACARLQREGCPTLQDCPAVYGDIERDRLRPMPDRQPLTCMAIVNAVRLEDVGLRCP